MFASFCANAQYENWTEAEIYLKDGKVLQGRVILPYVQKGMSLAGKEKVRFKIDPKKVSKKISAKDIAKMLLKINYSEKVKGKRIKKQRDATFIVISKNKKNTKFGFAELIVDGKVKLVKRVVAGNSNNQYGSTVESLFIKNNEMAVPFNYIGIKSFKKSAKNYFSDCSSLVSKIDNKEFNRKNLREIAEYYNANCNK